MLLKLGNCALCASSGRQCGTVEFELRGAARLAPGPIKFTAQDVLDVLLAPGLYIDYPDGAGNSKLTNVLIERKLETRGTARNWNTALKIADMARTS